MKRLTSAPNLAIAALWVDLLRQAGVEASVQRIWTSSIAGELPLDQTLPEVWVHDDDQLDSARVLLHQMRHPRVRHWRCPACGEQVDGPFMECWNCGGAMPES